MNRTRLAALATVLFCAACVDATQPIAPAGVDLSYARTAGGGIRLIDLGTLGGRTSHGWGVNPSANKEQLLVVGDAQNAAGQTRASYWIYDRASGTASPARALVTDGDSQSAASDANDSHEISGWSYKWIVTNGVITGSTKRAVRWTTGGESILLGESLISGSAINSAGQIVGTGANSEGQYPFLWDENPAPQGTLTDLGFFSGTDIQQVGRNEAGTIVGAVRRTPTDLQTAFAWSAAAGVVLLPGLGPPPARDGIQSYATAINNAGVIVGFVNTSGIGVSAVRWVSNGTGGYEVKDLGLGAGSRANDINNVGEIVGNFRGKRYSTGFYLKGSTFKELPILSNSAVARRINEQGEIVGFSYFRNTYSHAVVWTNVRDQ